MIRILRPAGDTGLLTAAAFESLFRRHLARAFELRPVPLGPWLDQVLGPPHAPLAPAAASRALADATRGIHFLCPAYEAVPLLPLLAALRNRAGAPVRFVVISHAAGAYTMEWALLAPLLGPGDRVIAPSESARRTIEFICPALAPRIAVIHHPMEPPPAGPRRAGGERPRLVSLGRIHAGKLLHRQIDAMDVLRARGRPLPVMEIAGALDDGPTPGIHPYARSLAARIRRLGLEEQVRLVGPVRGDAAKGAFLSGADVLVNLSVTVEESFPKTPVEALGVGTPVVATAWDGLHESAGGCGAMVPVRPAGTGFGTVDVDAAAVADAIEQVLDGPPPRDACLAHAARFRPGVGVERYRQVLAGALDEGAAGELPPWPDAALPAAPAGGALAATAPLPAFSWREMFALYADGCPATRASALPGAPAYPPAPGHRLHAVANAAVRPALECFLAALPLPPAPSAPPRPPPPEAAPDEEGGGFGPVLSADELAERLAAAGAPGRVAGRLASLTDLMQHGETARFARGLRALERQGVGGASVEALRAEAALHAGDAAAAWAIAAGALRAAPPEEPDALRLRQVARIARRLGQPERALPPLADWLGRYPDAQESGPVWLELGVNACHAGRWDEAEGALERARALLGPLSAIEKAERMLAGRRVEAALA
ncbi:MAG TPA: glycosyltransferase [Longimicrobium sp.]|nr:glycosyltransferase [Longimicrobium sp.]